jgi:hypothetical protein
VEGPAPAGLSFFRAQKIRIDRSMRIFCWTSKAPQQPLPVLAVPLPLMEFEAVEPLLRPLLLGLPSSRDLGEFGAVELLLRPFFMALEPVPAVAVCPADSRKHAGRRFVALKPGLSQNRHRAMMRCFRSYRPTRSSRVAHPLSRCAFALFGHVVDAGGDRSAV